MPSTNTALKDTNSTEAQTAAATDTTAAPQTVDIDTRFGVIRVVSDQTVTMPRGMPGFPGLHHYAIGQLHDERFAQFLVLQCLDKPSLSFLLLPEAAAPGLISDEHRQASAQDLGVVPDDLALAFVVTIRKLDGKAEISANLRAPVIVDTTKHLAWQHILPFGDYSVRHVIITAQGSANP